MKITLYDRLAVTFVHLLALCMTGIMILHIRSKYTAVVCVSACPDRVE